MIDPGQAPGLPKRRATSALSVRGTSVAPNLGRSDMGRTGSSVLKAWMQVHIARTKDERVWGGYKSCLGEQEP